MLPVISHRGYSTAFQNGEPKFYAKKSHTDPPNGLEQRFTNRKKYTADITKEKLASPFFSGHLQPHLQQQEEDMREELLDSFRDLESFPVQYFNKIFKGRSRVTNSVLEQITPFLPKINGGITRDWNRCLMSLAEKKQYMYCRYLFDRMTELEVPKTVTTYNALIYCAAMIRHLGKAFELFEALKKRNEADPSGTFRPNTSTYHYLVHACARCGELSRCLELFKLMKMKFGDLLGPTTYSTLINACGRAGNIDVAFQLISLMQSEGEKVNELTWTSLITAFSKTNYYTETEALVTKYKNLGFKLNMRVYGALIESCARMGNVDKALNYFSEMEQEQVRPTEMIYNLLLNVCASVGQKEKAMLIYKDMMEKKMEPNVITFYLLLVAGVNDSSNACLHACDVVSMMRLCAVKPNGYILDLLQKIRKGEKLNSEEIVKQLNTALNVKVVV